jgi:hypothetical protein
LASQYDRLRVSQTPSGALQQAFQSAAPGRLWRCLLGMAYASLSIVL